MIKIPTNFGKESTCFCGKNETMSHIYYCERINKEQERIDFEKVYNGKYLNNERFGTYSRKI